MKIESYTIFYLQQKTIHIYLHIKCMHMFQSQMLIILRYTAILDYHYLTLMHVIECR